VKIRSRYRHKAYLQYPKPIIFNPQQTAMFCVLRIWFCLPIVVCVFASCKHEKIKFIYWQDNLVCGSKIDTGYYIEDRVYDGTNLSFIHKMKRWRSKILLPFYILVAQCRQALRDLKRVSIICYTLTFLFVSHSYSA